MASIVVLTGEHDTFHKRSFMLQQLFPFWIEAGHFVVVHVGPAEPPPADVAILHVDLTVVPPEYKEWFGRYPVVVNGASLALGKRALSRHLVTRGDGYSGPVVVKTDANAGGLPELHWVQQESMRGRRVEAAPRYLKGPYPIFDCPDRVPPEVWDDPQLVVERFLPERDRDGYALRVYIFFGDSERCTRVVGPHPIVKGVGATSRVAIPVPEEARAWRRSAGLDYGKIDFVVHEGTPVMLDANRTPTMPSGAISAAVAAGLQDLAGGIESFCRRG